MRVATSLPTMLQTIAYSGPVASGDPPLRRALEGPWRLAASRNTDLSVIAEISRSVDERTIAYVAKPLAGHACIVLRLREVPDSGSGVDRVEFVRQAQLDESIGANDLQCPHCGHTLPTWAPACSHCRQPVAGAPGSTIDASRDDVYAAVAQTLHGKFALLGELPIGSAAVYIATDLETEAIVALRLGVKAAASWHTPADSLVLTPLTYLAALAQDGATVDTPAPHQFDTLPQSSPHSGEVNPLTDQEHASVSRSVEVVSASDAGESPHPSGKVCPKCNSVYNAAVRFCPSDGSSLHPLEESDDLIDQVIDNRYHLVRLLGEGGMGRVYLAEHVQMGRRCALKVLHPNLDRTQDAVRRFSREAKNASRIQHPNVATVYDFGETQDGLVYLAMEFIDGESLSAVIARGTRLAVDRALVIAREVAEGLQAAHALGIIHRDLKPDNIMIARSDTKETVKVVDFGIAKAFHETSQLVTQSGLIVGTPRYMSPEQLAGATLDARSDVYSLGCVLYEMLTGLSPGEASNLQALIFQRLSAPPLNPKAHRPDISTAVNALVARATERDPDNRIQSAAAFRDLAVASHGAARGQLPSIRRPRRPTTVARALAVVGACVVAYAGWRYRVVSSAHTLQRAAIQGISSVSVDSAANQRSTPPATASTGPIPPNTDAIGGVDRVAGAPLATKLPTATPIERPKGTRAPTTPPDTQSSTDQGSKAVVPPETLDQVDQNLSLGIYFSHKDPPDYVQALQKFRAASAELTSLSHRFPNDATLHAKAAQLDSAWTRTRHECADLAAASAPGGVTPASCQ